MWRCFFWTQFSKHVFLSSFQTYISICKLYCLKERVQLLYHSIVCSTMTDEVNIFSVGCSLYLDGRRCSYTENMCVDLGSGSVFEFKTTWQLQWECVCWVGVRVDEYDIIHGIVDGARGGGSGQLATVILSFISQCFDTVGAIIWKKH